MTFGEKLYHLRTQQGISQEALARKLDVSRQAISRWELGEVVPDTANVLAVSRLFGVSTDYLLRNDILALCSLCFLPLVLFWLPGNFPVLFAAVAAAPFLQETWQLLRKARNLPEPPPRKRWRKS